MCVFWLAAFAKTAGQSATKYSPAEAGEILAEFGGALRTYHPFAYRGRGTQLIDSAMAVARARLGERKPVDSLYAGEVIALAGPIRATIGDGHLQLRPTRDKGFIAQQAKHRYELALRRSDDGALLLSDSLVLRDSTVLPKGAEVIALENRPTAGLIAEVAAFVGVDDHDLRSAREWYPAHYLPTFYQRAYGWHDSLLLTTVDGGGDTASVFLYPRDTEREKGKREKLGRRAQLAQSIYLDTTALAGVYRLGVASFSKGELGKADAYRKLRKLMKQLRRDSATGLVIDVRSNTGGSAALVDHLYGFIAEDPYLMLDSMIGYTPRAWGKNVFERVGNYLFGGVRRDGDVWTKRNLRKPRKPKRRNHFDGDVVVLTNEITFSGGSVFAHYVKYYRRGRVVGQVPGGSAERMFAGDLFEVLIGPREEFRINMPLWYMDMVGDARGNVQPDVIVPRTRENQLDGTDAPLEAALELLKPE